MKLDLQKSIRNLTRRENIIPAIVLDVVGSRASVRLIKAGGARLKNLRVVGGPIALGQAVSVNYSTSVPYIDAHGQAEDTTGEIQEALGRLGQVSSGGSSSVTGWMINRFTEGALAGVFEPSSDGLTAAFDAALSGDIILYPNAGVEADVTIPEGVTFCGINSKNCIVYGTVTLTADSELRDMAVIAAVNNVSEIRGVVGPSSGECFINDCNVFAFNCGSGDAIGVLANAGDVWIRDCRINGESESGYGCAVKQA